MLPEIKTPAYLLFLWFTAAVSITMHLTACAQSDTIRYIVRGSGMSEIVVSQVPLEEFLQPGESFQAVRNLGAITDSAFHESEYGPRWVFNLPGIELEYIDAGEPTLQRILVTDPEIPVMIDGENVFNWRMNEPLLARLKALENRNDRMTLVEKFGGAPEYWELFVDPGTGKVIGLILELGMH